MTTVPTTTLEQVFLSLIQDFKTVYIATIQLVPQVGPVLRKLNLALNYFNELGSTGVNQVITRHQEKTNI